MHVAVLGAGLAGLAAAYELARAGVRVTVLEREPQPGGMARSWRKGPFWLDLGPHRFHTRDAELLEHFRAVLDQDVVVRQRRSRILLRGRAFDYPLRLSNVLSNLPPGLLARAGLDWAWARAKQRLRPAPDAHFEAWVLQRFGRTLHELFFGTYTEKAWGLPCTQISADWAAQRISQSGLLDVLRTTLWPPRSGELRSLASEFHYPRHGGIGQLARKYAEKIRAAGGEIVLDARCTGFERRGGRIARVRFEHLGASEELECDQVVSTTPLPALARALEPGADGAARQDAAGLRHIAIVFVYLELARPSLSPDHWIYLPEKHLRIHRVSEFKNFSDQAAPGDRSAICCEITCRRGDATWNLNLEQAAAVAASDLAAAGLAQPSELRALDIARLSHAYPVYDLPYRARVERLLESVRRCPNLTTTGRQGLFRYNNMDHSLALGRDAAWQLLGAPTAEAVTVAPQEYFG